tara:strand:+ start:625 stop:2418 length:1794 start_codon:yes stop_codon:yes gene_type:complete
MNRGSIFHVFFVFFVLGATACSSSSSSQSTPTSTYEGIAPGPAEATYCSTTTSYSSPITITGTATYQARVTYGTKPGGGLGNAGSAKPVRYAEIMVKNSAGSTVQCGETLVDGTFSLQMPNDGNTYTLYVNTRANNSKAVVSVMDRPALKNYYSLTTSFVANGSKSVGTLNAAVTGDILGGAFNIFDQIVETNNYLRTEASSCSSTYTGCQDFSVAPKVEAYWMKGVNPATYLGSTSALSFYLPGYSRLFILGGLNGDTDNTDTDHFDNSVIIHEYGHFLEDVVFGSNSPGGSHSGDKIIDPRLAWSEGWGNFIQAAVLNTSEYIDTTGNIDGSTAYIFKLDLETAQTGNDIPTASGEGNFREFSVTRFLWDMIDSNADTRFTGTDNVSGAFKDIWASLTKSTQGFKNANVAFRNIGIFHTFQTWLQSNNSGKDLSELIKIERQVANTSEYAQYVTTSGSCTYTITPYNDPNDTGSFSTANLHQNNDFFHIRPTSSGTYTISLEYSDSDSSGTEADADLYLYNKSARIGQTADIVAKSTSDPDGNPATSQTESFAVSLTGGTDYLLNVFVYTGGTLGGAFTYKIKMNGSELCQSNLY